MKTKQFIQSSISLTAAKLIRSKRLVEGAKNSKIITQM